MDVPVAYLLVWNLRDSHVEDNVRKRPLPQRFDSLALSDYIESVTKVVILFCNHKEKARIFRPCRDN